MIINGTEVVFNEQTKQYTYFACTCAEQDKLYWDKAITEILGGDSEDKSNGLVYTICHVFDGSVTSVFADMWMGLGVELAGVDMYITCDQLHYGLACAVLIATELNPEMAKEYELDGLLSKLS